MTENFFVHLAAIPADHVHTISWCVDYAESFLSMQSKHRINTARSQKTRGREKILIFELNNNLTFSPNGREAKKIDMKTTRQKRWEWNSPIFDHLPLKLPDFSPFQPNFSPKYSWFSHDVIKIRKQGIINPFEILVPLVTRTSEDLTFCKFSVW